MSVKRLTLSYATVSVRIKLNQKVQLLPYAIF